MRHVAPSLFLGGIAGLLSSLGALGGCNDGGGVRWVAGSEEVSDGDVNVGPAFVVALSVDLGTDFNHPV